MIGKRVVVLFLLAAALSCPALVFSSDIPVDDERCQAPPFYTAASEPPNILFVMDVSGSMGWGAYRYGDLAIYKGNEEGYFNPQSTYKYDTADSTWKEVSGPPVLPVWASSHTLKSPDDDTDICSKKEYDITNNRGSNVSFKGSCLNALLMDRIDVARWALTGGRPKGCNSLTSADCDPTAGVASSCDATGCVLEMNTVNRGYVKVPPSRIDGFIQSAEGLTSKPRMGASFYSGSDLRTEKVYIGDYPSGNNADATKRYTYLKRYINYVNPGGGTPTKRGMEEAHDYFAQSNHYHDSSHPFLISKGHWQDPLARCTYDKKDCEPAGWCTKNFVILLSDGEWNNGGDPIFATYRMHTNLGRTFDGHEKNIDKVYTIGLFMQGNGINAMQHMAMYGSFDYTASNEWPGGTGGSGYLNHYPNTSLTTTIPAYDQNNPNYDWDSNPTDGVPDTYFAPQNGADLKRNLFAIFGDIASNRGAAASVATVTQNVLGEDVVVRGAFFHDPTAEGDKLWEGHLESYWPDPACLVAETQSACTSAGCTWDSFPASCSNKNYATQILCEAAGFTWLTTNGECLPYDYENRPDDQVFCKESDDNCWDAFFKLPKQADRDIFTYINGIKVDITTDNVTQLHPLLANTVDFDADHDVDIADSAQLITWIREGSKHDDWKYTVRKRSGDLGDIVYSAPLIVGAPSLGNAPKKVAMDSCQEVEPCFAHTDASSCSSDSSHGCSWNVFEEICEAPACSSWEEASTCGSQPTCTWNAATTAHCDKYNDSGDIVCSSLTDESSCNNRSTCTWVEATAGTCSNKDADAICTLSGADECFYTYQMCNSKRKKVAMVAANDGMLHAFVVSTWDSTNGKWLYDPAEDSEIGMELWAYIPSNLLSEMSCLAAYNYGDAGGCRHRTTLDLSPMAWDITLEAVSGSCSGSSTPSSTIDNQSDCEDAGYTWACTATTQCSGLSHTECQNASECSPGCASGTYDCTQISDQTICDNTQDCSWDADCTGQYDCTLLPDTQTCSDAGCSWQNITGCSWVTNGFCTTQGGSSWHCGSNDNQTDCENDSYWWWGWHDCKWNVVHECDGNFNCSQLSDSTACGNYSSICSWRSWSSSCVRSWGRNCDDLSSESACNLYQSSSGCTGGSSNDCSSLDDATCSNVASCTLQPASCVGTGTCVTGNCQTDIGCTETCDGNTTCTDYECTGDLTCSAIGSQSSCTSAGCDWTTGISEPWRTVIVGGQRGGGDLYFALDVTDPDNPSLLWEHSVLRNMVALKSATNGYEAFRPYKDKDVYNELIKTHPFTWSTPYVARWGLPADICFSAEDTLLYPLSANPTGSDIKCWQEKTSGANRLSGWYAFVGGGNRMTDEDKFADCSDFTSQAACGGVAFCSWSSATSQCSEVPGIREQLFQPFMMALDMGTGVDIFQYLWPTVQRAFADKWPVSAVNDKNVPHSMTTPMVFDLWKGVDTTNKKPIIGSDGKMDHIFVGDISGHYWGIYMDGNPETHNPRIYIDRWQTKKAYNGCSDLSSESACEDTNACWWNQTDAECQEGYGTRGPLQPVSAASEAAFDSNGNLRLYFGTGKFEHVVDAQNDRNDKGKNSFYNITLPLNKFTNDDDQTCTVTDYPANPKLSCAGGDDTVKLSANGDDLYIHLQDHNCNDCEGTADIWVNPPDSDDVRADYVGASCGSDDCGCSADCYQCIMDLTTPGEKVLGKPLVAGGLVFFTTYVPKSSTCGAGGDAYLYVVDYMCRPLGSNPLNNSGLVTIIYYSDSGNSEISAVRSELGKGMPSQPVLDSTGEHVLIQTSDAEIKRVKIELPDGDAFKGWHEEMVEE